MNAPLAHGRGGLTTAVLLIVAGLLAGFTAPDAGRPQNAAALYNAGNAYARAGEPALAILNYQRAQLLAPTDADLAANLRAVRHSAQQPSPDVPRLTQLATAVSPTVCAWLGVIGIVALGAALVVGRLTPRYGGWCRLGGIVGALLLALPIGNAVALWPTLHAAVVVTPATPVRVSPALMGDPLFNLPLAETVRIVARHEDFLLIKTRDGKSGWAAAANVVPVVPE